MKQLAIVTLHSGKIKAFQFLARELLLFPSVTA